MVKGEAQRREIDMLLDVSKQIEGTPSARLAMRPAWPVQGLIRHFRHVIEGAHRPVCGGRKRRHGRRLPRRVAAE